MQQDVGLHSGLCVHFTFGLREKKKHSFVKNVKSAIKCGSFCRGHADLAYACTSAHTCACKISAAQAETTLK